jgi:hypothetical protein
MTKGRLKELAREANQIAKRDEPEPDEVTVRAIASYIAELATHLAGEENE